jgi:exosortase
MNSPGTPISPSHGFDRSARTAWLVAASFGVMIAWASWPTFVQLARHWNADPQASHGYVVPMLAVVVLLFRRHLIAFGPGAWWSVPFFGAGAVCRLLEARYYFPWFGPFSLIPTLAGVALAAGGWPLLRWAWPGLVMLLFMLPLPFTVEAWLSWPLQKVATATAAYTLQTLGQPAYAEGNVIFINDHQIGVLEACNGLGMLVAFFALSTAMAFIIDRPWVDRLVVFLSALPIAVVMNLVRVSATGLAHVALGSQVATGVFHVVAGWLMMPAALLALWLELKLYDRLLVSDAGGQRSAVGSQRSEVGSQKSEVGGRT